MKAIFFIFFLNFTIFSNLYAFQNACSNAIKKIELEERIPRLLMQAISVVESGRSVSNSEHICAWPWTLNVEGKGEYYPTKQEAVDRVKLLLRQGIKSIDVGCMQINLAYHPDAFKNIETALDPYENARYAAKFLKQLMEEKKSWSIAIGHYHSRLQPQYTSYRKRVYDQWNMERLKDSGIHIDKKRRNITQTTRYNWLFNMRPPVKRQVYPPTIAPKRTFFFMKNMNNKNKS